MIKYQPKTKQELISVIKQEIKKQGPDADLNFIDTSLITNMSKLFNWPSVTIDTTKDIIRNIKIDQWDVSNVTDMYGMFGGMHNLANLNLSILLAIYLLGMFQM